MAICSTCSTSITITGSKIRAVRRSGRRFGDKNRPASVAEHVPIRSGTCSRCRLREGVRPRPPPGIGQSRNNLAFPGLRGCSAAVEPILLAHGESPRSPSSSTTFPPRSPGAPRQQSEAERNSLACDTLAAPPADLCPPFLVKAEVRVATRFRQVRVKHDRDRRSVRCRAPNGRSTTRCSGLSAPGCHDP